MTLDDILVEIKQAETIVVMAHESPDGDAIGSVLSMNLALKKMGKKVDVIVKEFPRTFSFLPGANTVKTTSDIETYDLAIDEQEIADTGYTLVLAYIRLHDRENAKKLLNQLINKLMSIKNVVRAYRTSSSN